MQHVQPSSTGGAGSPEPQASAARLVLATMAVVTAFQNQQTAHPLAQTMLLGILCGLSVAAAVGAGRGRRLPP